VVRSNQLKGVNETILIGNIDRERLFITFSSESTSPTTVIAVTCTTHCSPPLPAYSGFASGRNTRTVLPALLVVNPFQLKFKIFAVNLAAVMINSNNFRVSEPPFYQLAQYLEHRSVPGVVSAGGKWASEEHGGLITNGGHHLL